MSSLSSSGQENVVLLETTPLGSNLFYSNLPSHAISSPTEFTLNSQHPIRKSNQKWLNQSIHHLTFWKINQEFLGMELCEPMDFEWETWGDNKYSDLNLQVKRLEYLRFISKSH